MNDERTVVGTIGRYQILGELGRGAMGVVYRGFDPVIRRPIALKTISFAAEDGESPALRQRLYREAVAAGTLIHPNIVTVYDVVEDGAATAVAMELVEGQTLAALISRTGGLPFGQALGIFEQVCAALDYAGSNGIVHRDIKPANILLTPDGCPKILDFGIARMSVAGVTQTSTVMGSPSYMSPEQVRGLPLDSRSDLFSAAVVFFEMISGQRPFVGDDVATTMYRIVSGPPRAIEQFVPAIQPAVSRVIDWALSKDPASRPRTGRDLIDALRYAAASGGGSATAGVLPAELPVASPVEYPGRETREPERVALLDVHAARRPPLLLAGAIGSGLLFIGVLVAFFSMRPEKADLLSAGGGGAPAATTTSAGDPSMPDPAERRVQAAPPQRDATAGGPVGLESAGTGRARTGAAVRLSGGLSTGGSPPVSATSTAPNRASASGAAGAAAPTSVAPPPLPPPTVVPAGSASLPKTTAALPVLPAAPPATTSTKPTTLAPASASEATIVIEFEGSAYPVTLFAGEARLGRLETTNGSVGVEPGSLRLRAVNDSVFLDTLLPPIAVRAGERRAIALPGLSSAAFGMKGEDYTGVRLLIDGRPIPGPYPAQVARIAAGTHRVAYRWVSGPAAGREVSDDITLSAGGHFLVRAALDNDKLVVQQLR